MPGCNRVLAMMVTRTLAPASKLTTLRGPAEATAVSTLGETLDAGLDEERARWHSRLCEAAEALAEPIGAATRRETRHLKVPNEQPADGSCRRLGTTPRLVVMPYRCRLESWAGSRTRSRRSLRSTSFDTAGMECRHIPGVG